ncbi:hypothetical protein LINPERPRIM_LOCUS16444 [Linum perenne]
MPTAAGDDKVR